MSDVESWITTVEAVRAFRDQLESEGRKLVFTNGCFDLLHAGHVRYLREARALGDALVVALNSDASVRELKGEARPINTQEDRAEILMALQSVNGVLVFDEPRVTRLIEAVQPHIYAKGGDYTLDTLNAEERSALDAVGASICLLPLVPGRSTTSTIQRMQLGETPPASQPVPPSVAETGGDDGELNKSPEDEAAERWLDEVLSPLSSSAPAPAGNSEEYDAGSETHQPALSGASGPTITPRMDGLSIQSRSPAGPLRLGILGSGQGTNFDAILRAIEEQRLHAVVSVVISDVESSGILTRAANAGLKTVFVDPGPNAKVLGTEAQKEIHDQLRAHQVQVVVLTGFMRVIKEPLMSGFRNRIVNIHPSLLPKFKGKAAWVQALEEGELETGCTVHLVNEEVDGGRILEQAVVPIHIGDTADDVFYRIQAEEHKLLPKVLNEWRERGLEV